MANSFPRIARMIADNTSGQFFSASLRVLHGLKLRSINPVWDRTKAVGTLIYAYLR